LETPENIQQAPPKKGFFRKLFRFIFWLVFLILILLITAVSLVFIYEDDVKAIIIKELNKNLNAEIKLDPKDIDLTIIKTFPDCALEFKNIACMEAIKSEKRDTLVFAKTLQLKFDIEDLWNKKYDVKKIKMSDAFCRLKVNSKGKPNYIVWKEPSATDTIISNDSLEFKLENIELVNVDMSYADNESKVKTVFTIKHVELSGDFSDESYELTSEGDLYVTKISVQKTEYIRNKNVNFKAALDVVKDLYKIKLCDVHLNKMALETNGKLVYGDSLSELNLDFKGKNLDIQSVLSLMPESEKDRIRDYKSEGNFYVSGNMNYKTDLDVSVDFGVSNTTVIYQPKDAKLSNLNAQGRFVRTKKQTLLELKNVSGDLISDHFNGDMTLTDFNDPYLDLKISGTLDLENFTKFWPVDTLSKLKGKIQFNGLVKSKIEELKKNVLSENATLELQASLKDLVVQFKDQKDSTNVYSCELRALNRLVEVNNLAIKKGNSDMKINGKLEGAFNYILDRNNPLKVYGNLKSERIVVEDFIYENSKTNSSEKSQVDVPDNINFILDARIESLSFGKFSASKLDGNIELKNKKILAENVNLLTMDGNAAIDALIDLSGKNLEVSMHGELNKINVSKMFSQLNNFDQETLKDDNVSGSLNASIDFSGTWDKFLEADLNSMKAVSDLQIDQGRLVNFKPLESLANYVDINELKDIKFSTLRSRIEIGKSIITIPRTAIKNSALNIDFWGTHSFNNDIDYHIQLLISDYLSKKRKPDPDDEFGLVENDPENHRSAFILMTGTVDNPKIKYDRKGMKQKIREDIKNEGQNMKKLFKDEFGLFKKDSIKVKENKKSDQTFKLEDPNKKKDPNKEEDEEDF
jgi:hypothetical protein